MNTETTEDISIGRTSNGDVVIAVETQNEFDPVTLFTLSEKQTRYLFSQSGKVLSNTNPSREHNE